MRLFFRKKQKRVRPTEIICFPLRYTLNIQFAGTKETFSESTEHPGIKKQFKAVIDWANSDVDTSFILEHETGVIVLCRGNINWIRVDKDKRSVRG